MLRMKRFLLDRESQLWNMWTGFFEPFPKENIVYTIHKTAKRGYHLKNCMKIKIEIIKVLSFLSILEVPNNIRNYKPDYRHTDTILGLVMTTL